MPQPCELARTTVLETDITINHCYVRTPRFKRRISPLLINHGQYPGKGSMAGAKIIAHGHFNRLKIDSFFPLSKFSSFCL